jgi:hypothetical protein
MKAIKSVFCSGERILNIQSVMVKLRVDVNEVE